MLSSRAIEEQRDILASKAKLVRLLESVGCTVRFALEDGRRDERRRFLVEVLAPLDTAELDLEAGMRDRILLSSLVEYALENGLGELGEIYAQAETRAAEEIRQRDEAAAEGGRQ
ncbi:MAG TPA: hypothetical protein P5142_00265 [Spirochaetia bacterium]|nr:hypothetical protein [Spirochaetia bacterium]